MGTSQNKAESNVVLGVSPTKVCKGNASTPNSSRGPIMCAYISLQANPNGKVKDTVFCHVVLAHRSGAEMFCLITGERRSFSYEMRRHTTVSAAVRLSSVTHGELLVLADSRGRFIALDASTLRQVSEFGTQENPSARARLNPVTSLKRIASDCFAVGYASGEVKVWEFNATEPKTTYHSQLVGSIGGVRCLEVSVRHSLIFSGHEGSFENEHGRYMKLQQNPVRVMAFDSVQVKSLEGIEDSCVSMSVLDSKNLLLAGSAIENLVILWDFITQVKLMAIKVPQLGHIPAVVTAVFAKELDENQDIILFGLSDGTTLVGALAISPEPVRLSWQPMKLIKPKRKVSTSEESMRFIANIQYETAFDILLLGDAQSELRLINNFIRECFPENFPKAPSPLKPEVGDKKLQKNEEAEALEDS